MTVLNLRRPIKLKIKLGDHVRIIKESCITYGRDGWISADHYSKEKKFIVSFGDEWIGYYNEEDLEKIYEL